MCESGAPLSHKDLIEVSLEELDDETARAVAEVFDRWGWGGAIVEELVGDKGQVRSTIKTYLAAGDIPLADASAGDYRERLGKIETGLALLNCVRATQRLPDIPLPQLRRLAETDWAEAWKSQYHMFRVGRRLVVKPSWEKYARPGPPSAPSPWREAPATGTAGRVEEGGLPQPDDVVIEIDPGMAFGSGLHPSTQLCLEMLEESLRPGERVLDVGTGSGILAIAAGKLGAAWVLALDTDPLAVQVAIENVRLNGLEHVIDVRPGTLDADASIVAGAPSADQPSGFPGLTMTPLRSAEGHRHRQGTSAGGGDESPIPLATTGDYREPQQWSIVVANILAETIVDMAPALTASLAAPLRRQGTAAGGALIASGIIRERAAEVVGELRRQGLRVIEQREHGDWVALKAQR